jgi:hypothetical protein
MKNTNDLDRASMNAIDRKIWQAAENKLAGVRLSACSAVLRELREQIDLTVEGERDSAGSSSAASLLDVIADVGKIVNGSVRPADVHQPG